MERCGRGIIMVYSEGALIQKNLKKKILIFGKETLLKNFSKVEIWDSFGHEGDIGAGYGFQWRHFGAEYIDCNTDYKGDGCRSISRIV